jgi:hypothetical protein
LLSDERRASVTIVTSATSIEVLTDGLSMMARAC